MPKFTTQIRPAGFYPPSRKDAAVIQSRRPPRPRPGPELFVGPANNNLLRKKSKKKEKCKFSDFLQPWVTEEWSKESDIVDKEDKKRKAETDAEASVIKRCREESNHQKLRMVMLDDPYTNGFFPENEPDELPADFEFPEGLSEEEMRDALNEILEEVERQRKRGKKRQFLKWECEKCAGLLMNIVQSSVSEMQGFAHGLKDKQQFWLFVPSFSPFQYGSKDK
ncbi:hypothetical protein VTO42DRAFT_1249 [Malbranchea cinnamomea]